jgi:type I pantothenate kinase
MAVVIGITGSVASGKTSFANYLKGEIERDLRYKDSKVPTIAVVSTDGFLYPNSVLTANGHLGVKVFPI